MPSETIGCGEVADQITLYLEGALPAVERERLEAHGRVCSGCRTRLAQMRTVVQSLGRLGDRREGPIGPERERILGVFREQGLHRPGPRRRRVPLGFAEAAVASGDHLAYLWESEKEYEAAFDFLAAGAGQGETCILLGHGEDTLRAEAGFKRAGFDPAALRSQGRLHVIPGGHSGDALLEEIGERIKAAVDRGDPLVRIFGNAGWGRPGWPNDLDLLRLEARVNGAIRNLPAVVMCGYDARGVPGRNFRLGGLQCHPWTFRSAALSPNDQYIPAEPFLAALGASEGQDRTNEPSAQRFRR